MTGPVSSVTGNVNHIKRLLDEQYRWDGDGFTIWKELIQNANDAEARVLHIGWCRGFEACDHPLLRTPALFLVNDGSFTEDDARAIVEIGHSAKSTDTSKIGRFGLGMKSLFHVCEALFFLSSDLPNTNGDWQSRNDVFSPWLSPPGSKGRSPRTTWDRFSPENKALITDRLAPVLRGLEEWFCLWIPLRCAQQLEGKPPLAKSKFENEPNVRTLFPTGLDWRIAELLPLLDRLEIVTIWDSPPVRDIRITSRIELPSTETLRFSLRNCGLKSAKVSHKGEVAIHSGNGDPPVRGQFLRMDHLLHQTFLKRFQENDQWPMDPDENDENWTPKPVKAMPHGAVRFLARSLLPGERPRLVLNWAVFLPLSEATESVSLASWTMTVSVFLHGYFFVDAGRNRLKHGSPDADDIRVRWNRELEDEVTLPLLLPALAEFVCQHQCTDSSIHELTRSFSGSTLYKERCRSICRDYEWMFVVVASETDQGWQGEWKLVPADWKCLTLPRPPFDVSPFRLLPELAVADSKTALVFRDIPSIAAGEPPPWPLTQLVATVSSLDTEVAFSSRKRLAYFAAFLECCVISDERKAAVGDPLWKLLKQVFQSDTITLATLEDLHDELRRVLEFVPANKRVILTWATSNRPQAEDVFRLIAADSGELLPIPPSASPFAESNCDSVDGQIIIRLFKAIEPLPLASELLADVLESLLDLADPKREFVPYLLAGSQLLITFDCQQRKSRRIAWQDLLLHKRLAFCDHGGLTPQLQDALGTTGAVWRIHPEFARKVFRERLDLPKCTPESCAAVLAATDNGRLPHLNGTLLAAWSDRKGLLEKITGHGDFDDNEQVKVKDACRLLIHGCIDDAGFNGSLFLAADGQFDPVAETLVRHVLLKRGGPQPGRSEEWRIIGGDPAAWVTSKLNPQWRDALDVVSLKLSEPLVLKFLETAKSSQIEGLEISKEDYATLMTSIDATHDGLLKRLPIHPMARQKRRVSIPVEEPQSMFWDDGFELDRELTTSITLLALDRNMRVATRQKELAPVLDRNHAIRLALAGSDPHHHWHAILKSIEKSDEQVPDDIISDLQSKKWLPTRFGGKGTGDVMCLSLISDGAGKVLSDQFKQDVNRLVDDCEGAYVPDWQFDEKLLPQLTGSHKSTRQLLQDWGVLPGELQSIENLGLLLSQDRNNFIGEVSSDHFEDWMNIEWDFGVMPVHRLLKELSDVFGIECCFEFASREIRTPINDACRLIEILNSLSSRHEVAVTQVSKDRGLQVFRRYLYFLLCCPDFAVPKLRTVRLLSQAGNWRSGLELCLPPAHNIARQHVLDETIAGLLRPYCSVSETPEVVAQQILQSSQSGEEIENTTVVAALAVEQYFRNWEQFLGTDVIGGFVALLGNDSGMLALADRYLGKRSLEETRLNFRITNAGIGPRRLKMEDHRFRVSIANENTSETTNLFGESFHATLGADCASLLIGFGQGQQFKIERHRSHRIICMRLRKFDPSVDQPLLQLLCDAAETLLIEAYGLEQELAHDRVTDTFSDLKESDQLEIRVTQQLILEDAELVLSQLGMESDDLLRPVIASLTRYRRLRAERAHNEERFNRPASWTEEEIDAEQSATNGSLRRLLEEDSDGQGRVLRAIRQRIQGHNQYNPSGIPFELFQNADDACQERQQLLNSGISCDSIQFFVRDDRLAVRHFGRCVNQVPPGQDPRSHRLSDDLRKMLTLWLSNKEAAEGRDNETDLTGKFGLGFKSVFLVCDRPRLLSGRLCCEIVGGMFPRHIDVSERQSFDRYMESLAPAQRREVTVIELPLSEIDETDGQDAANDRNLPRMLPIVGRFRELAHLLVIFAGRIRRIDVRDEGSERTYTARWDEQPVPGMTQCFKGNLTPFPDFLNGGKQGITQSLDSKLLTRALVLRTNCHRGALLLVHDGRRIRKLPKEVPTLWVTAPTQESLDVGFALNAKFSLDPGRAQLGRESPRNETIASDLGRELGQRLAAVYLHSQSVGWMRFCLDIGLDNDALEYDFWDSLWEILGPGFGKLSETSNAARILRYVFWDLDSGAAKTFYANYQVLPNGLRGQSQSLTRIDSVRYAIISSLASESVFPHVARLFAWVQKAITPFQCVARDDVIQPIEKFGRTILPRPVELVTLETLLRWECDIDNCLSPERAATIAAVLFHEQLNQSRNERSPEWRAIRKVLDEFRFPDCDGIARPSNQLIVPTVPTAEDDDEIRASMQDEAKLAAFAPKDRVLHPDFDGSVCVRLFRVCRESQLPPARDIATWAINARGSIEKTAVEHYLAAGRRRDSLIGELRNRQHELRNCWMAGLYGSAIFRTAEEREAEIAGEIEQHLTRRVRQDQSGRILKRVQEWWRLEGRESLGTRKYRLFDPSKHGPLRSDYDRTDIEQRKAWMRLFLLAMCHTMGRTQAAQDAGFVFDFCEQRGWLDDFVDLERRPERWVRILHEYLEPQIDTSRYLHWMRQFVGIFAMAERLDDYVESFLSIDRRNGPFALTAITCPRADHNSPVDPPPVARILGMGACFIVRELLRLNVIRSKFAWEHATVPSSRVCSLLGELGCQLSNVAGQSWQWSRELWTFLVDQFGNEDAATFDLAFDLPFQVLREDHAKCTELLGVSFDDDVDEETEW